MKNPVDEELQAKTVIYEELAQTLKYYADGWQSRLDALNKTVTDSPAAAAPDFQAACKDCFAPASEVQAGSDYSG